MESTVRRQSEGRHICHFSNFSVTLIECEIGQTDQDQDCKTPDSGQISMCQFGDQTEIQTGQVEDYGSYLNPDRPGRGSKCIGPWT